MNPIENPVLALHNKLKEKFNTEANGFRDPIDSVSVNIPLVIRIFEYMHEEVRDDIELHKIVENLIFLSKQLDRPLRMSDYSSIIATQSQ